MFSLEAIKAKHGDCLLLHWGKDDDPHVALIDGGPLTVYKDFLQPRLAALAKARDTDILKLDLTMVSHIDEDHIAGLIDLGDAILAHSAPAKIGLLWHNSLEGLLDQEFADSGAGSATASVGAAFPAMGGGNQWGEKVLASVRQGQLLHAFAIKAKIAHRLNSPFPKIGKSNRRLVMGGEKPVQVDGLSLHVVSPAPKEIDALRKEWVKLRKEGIMAGFDDDSPYNLSSIVVLAEFDKKRMLLTGDARGDVMLKGLEDAKLLKGGKIHVDLLKLPHHGSDNNVDEAFYENVTADIYVVSGDGKKFPNPNRDSMKWLADARGKDKYVIYCTYDLDYMRKIFGKRLVVPKKGSNSIEVVLS